MLKLVQRGSSWYVRGTIAGVRVFESARTSSEDQAKRYLATRQAQIYNQEQFGHRGAHTFAEALDLYLQSKPEVGYTTRRVLLDLLNYFDQTLLTRIDQSAIDRLIRKRFSRASPAHVIRSVIGPVTAVMRAAAKRNWCDPPMFDRPKVKPHRARFLSYEDANALVDAAAPHLAHLLIFLLNTGCRVGEALTLQWYAVDLKDRLVVFGKTEQDRTKNDETRGVPLNSLAFCALASLPDREGHVFLSNHGAPYPVLEGGGQIKTGFKAACRRAGIGAVRVHDLRHTFASWLAMAGHQEATIAELLGHKSRRSSITGRYTHLNRNHLRDAVESIVAGQQAATGRCQTGPKSASGRSI